jgi:hypothetical protein
LEHRSIFPTLGRVIKNPWLTGPVELDERALVAELAPEETVAIRLDQALEFDLGESGRAHVTRTSPRLLSLRRGRREIGRIGGDPARLDLLEHVLAGTADEAIGETLLPKDLPLFGVRVEERRELVTGLLAEGRVLVEEVERLVCALYDVPEGLTEDVIAHAVARGSRDS